MDAQWTDWAGRLADPTLPADAARAFVKRGDVGQRWDLTGNVALPQDVFAALVNDPDESVAAALLTNYELPTDMLQQLRTRFRGNRSLVEMIAHHPNAPVTTKKRLRLDGVTGAALERFFLHVGATAREKRLLAEIGREQATITLGRAWSLVRPSAD